MIKVMHIYAAKDDAIHSKNVQGHGTAMFIGNNQVYDLKLIRKLIGCYLRRHKNMRTEKQKQ